MCDQDQSQYYDWFNPSDYDVSAPVATPDQSQYYDWFNPPASDVSAPVTPSASPWYSGIGKGLGSILTSPDVWKYGGLIGSILAATQTPKTTTTGATTQTATPTLLPGAQAGVNEITQNALPWAQGNLLNPMGAEETSLYNYLMGGGGDVMGQMTNFGNQAQGYLQGGLQDLDINTLLAMVAPQITEATMKQFGPYAASKGGAQLATTQALTDKAAEFAKQRSAYQMQAAGLTPQIAATQATIMPELLKLAGTPQTRETQAYGTYMDTIRALLGLPAGTTGAGATTTTTPETSIWQRLAPLFTGMSTTGTPTPQASSNATGLATLLKLLGG